MNHIVVTNLHFSYTGQEEILKGINLIFNNKSTAIIGQNGSGKTTLVKLLKGLLHPTVGTIKICGKETSKTTVAELAKYIGLVFQNPNDQIFKQKVLDEVMFGPLNIGQDFELAKLNSLQALKMVGMDDFINANPYDLGLSERKLISIASILAMNTDIVILDEPTIAQDYNGREKIKTLIQKLKKAGKLVITIIHDMDFVGEVFERVIILQQGRVLLDGDVRDVFSRRDLLYSAGLEPPHVTQFGQKLAYDKTFLSVEEFIQFKLNEGGLPSNIQ